MEANAYRVAANTLAIVKRSIVAIGVAGTVAGVLRARGSGNTVPTYGGWTTIDSKEFETVPRVSGGDEENIAPVILLHPEPVVESVPQPKKVIGIEDIPQGLPSLLRLGVVGRLIDVEDIPVSTADEQ